MVAVKALRTDLIWMCAIINLIYIHNIYN